MLTYATFSDIILSGGVYTVNQRLKIIRKFKKMSQEEFGKKIGVTKTAVSKMELGTYNITDSMIKLVCKEFHINEDWLRHGEGEMEFELLPTSETATYVSSLLIKDNPFNDLIKALMSAYDKLDPKSQAIINESIALQFELTKKKQSES